MIDKDPNWRNHRWSLDGQYTEVDHVPLLVSQLEIHGKFWDGEFWFTFHGYKRYVVKWPDWRNNYRLPMENPKRTQERKYQKELSVFNEAKSVS